MVSFTQTLAVLLPLLPAVLGTPGNVNTSLLHPFHFNLG